MNQKISERIKELVIARLEVMPSNMKISIGSHGAFTRDDLKMHVEKEDEMGKESGRGANGLSEGDKGGEVVQAELRSCLCQSE